MDVLKHCSSQGFGLNNLIYQKCGYTFIELILTLAVSSILALSLFPSMSALLAQERSTVAVNYLAGALAYARSESISRNDIITTCQSNNGSDCNRSEYWQNGWIVFLDSNSNKQREPEEALLRAYPSLNNGTQLTFNGGRGIDHYVKYNSFGQASPNGSFLICNPDIGVGKALIVTHSGRVRLSKKQTNGRAITCN